MEVFLIVIFVLLGTAIGSFLNVCVDRLPAGKSLVYPPSHCEACQRRLSPQDLIPVFSYLWLRGRCRRCQAAIPRRLLWVEAGSGTLLAFFYWQYGLSVEFAVTAFYGYLFIVLGVIDLKHGLILNKIVYPSAAVALIISFFRPSLGIIDTPLLWPVILNGVVGGAVGFVLLLIPALISLLIYKQEGMGLGDVKMAALMGLVTGFPLIIVAILMGIILGGLVAGFLLLLGIKKRKETIPFGPFLSLATIATLLWGNNILGWYLGPF